MRQHKIMKALLHILLLLSLTVILHAQDSLAPPAKWTVTGYIKNLETLNFSNHFNDMVSGNLIHNRINVRWKPRPGLTAGLEFRNRLFWGEDVRANPDLENQLRNHAELIDLSLPWVRKNSYLLHTQVDRLWTEYQKNRWLFRIGRQRVNWGQTTVWNPNDIFNTYNFLDFDYEERPGTDAAMARYQRDAFTSASMVFAPGRRIGQSVAAFKYAFNTKGYDVQLIGGWYRGQPTVGAGWAGSIQDAGFKGECQYYLSAGDSSALLNISTEADYAFKKGWYLNLGFLYNSRGITKPLANSDELLFSFSPRNLMPTKWNMTVSTAKSFTPIFSGTFTVLYAPGTQLLLVLPGINYNLATNLDVDWVWQSFFVKGNNQFDAAGHRMFLRMKWSF